VSSSIQGCDAMQNLIPRPGMECACVTGRVSQAAADQQPRRAAVDARAIVIRLWSGGNARVLESTRHRSGNSCTPTRATGIGTRLLGCGGCDEPGVARSPARGTACSSAGLVAQARSDDAGTRVTKHGRVLQKLGMHPRLAHMRVMAARFGRSSAGMRSRSDS